MEASARTTRTPEPPPGLDALTGRELEVLGLVARGLTNAEAADRLFISEATVKTHLNRTMTKLGLTSRAQVVVVAYRRGWWCRGSDPPRPVRRPAGAATATRGHFRPTGVHAAASWVGSDVMEHEVFVPVAVQRLEETLADPARVARAVPGLQQDAGAEPVSGRLKVRVGSHSVTYRGSVRITRLDDGSYAAEGDAVEARGPGSVKLALTLRVEEAEDGSRLTFGGTASADGRLTELPADAVTSAVHRLLNRFAEQLAAAAQEGPQEPEPLVTQDFEAKATSDFETTPDADDAAAPAPDDARDRESVPEPADAVEPAAEAAHARRTMIGRSAEEVDHAPPRGRYAPVPAPQTVAAGSPLRWAAPAAALALASAIVVGRALRKRH
ncbi:carbon monoxide dehydrogenase [Streptomyces sp. MBT33]|nr:carbon monoxide dehydrogenase [Streptomyces sp. MBT33]